MMPFLCMQAESDDAFGKTFSGQGLVPSLCHHGYGLAEARQRHGKENGADE